MKILAAISWVIALLMVLVFIKRDKVASYFNKQEVIPKVKEVIKLNDDINGVKFTFDDGPDAANTPKVLDILKKYNLRATFFVEGINLVGDSKLSQRRREILKYAYDNGHYIGNHSFDHKDLCRLQLEAKKYQIDHTNELIKNITGQNPAFYRPPYGRKCQTVDQLLESRSMVPVYWEVDPREWQKDKFGRTKSSDDIANDVLNQIKKLNESGLKSMTVILHDTKSVTPDVLEKVIIGLKHAT